jgi:hypothetical protein
MGQKTPPDDDLTLEAMERISREMLRKLRRWKRGEDPNQPAPPPKPKRRRVRRRPIATLTAPREVNLRTLTFEQAQEYSGRGWIRRDSWGRWWTWYARLPPPERPPRPLPDRVPCARAGCPVTFLRLPWDLRRYCRSEHQQLTALERRHAAERIARKRAYDHARYLRLKPALNQARTRRRHLQRFRAILAMPDGRERRRALHHLQTLAAHRA